jgi:hypothetical protein
MADCSTSTVATTILVVAVADQLVMVLALLQAVKVAVETVEMAVVVLPMVKVAWVVAVAEIGSITQVVTVAMAWLSWPFRLAVTQELTQEHPLSQLTVWATQC